MCNVNDENYLDVCPYIITIAKNYNTFVTHQFDGGNFTYKNVKGCKINVTS